jgi:hypothetical protein
MTRWNRFLKYLLLPFFIFSINLSFSQYYSSGQDPASIRWMQINTDHYQIIFPKGFEEQSQYLANVMDRVYRLDTKSLKSKPRKISILLHNQNIIPNGTTVWAPRRVEMYTVSPQNTYAENWLKQLAIHEYRHVIQIERLNTGLTKALGVIFGEQATGGLFGTFIPRWFMEGDAVVTETALSHVGRGRIASFEMPLRAQLLEKGAYSYEKATHGSFRNFVPSEYHLGYQMVAYGRDKYGVNMWDQVMENVARNPIAIAPFSSGVEKVTGIRKRAFYEECMDYLKEKWKSEEKTIKYSEYTSITKKEKHYTNYNLPVYLNESKIIAEKSGMDDVEKFVIIHKNGEEEKILTPGSRLNQSLSFGNNILCWAEIESDVRWAHRNFSVIKLFNTKTKKKTSLTSRTRLFAPQINKDGNRIVAIDVSSENKYSLVILNAENGEEVKKYVNPDNLFMMHPSWSNDQKEIIMTVLTEKGKHFQVLNLETGQIQNVLNHTYVEISRPLLIGDNIYFIGAYSGIDNIYVYNRNSKTLNQVTSVRYGIGNFFIRDNEIVFSNYTADGFELASQKYIMGNEYLSLPEIKTHTYHFAELLSKQENNILELNQDNPKQYEVKKYHKTNGFFNFHSWGPASIDANNYEIKPGVRLMSQNILSTAFTTLGYEYDLSKKTGKYFANFTYKGWYPVIDVKLEYGKKRGRYKNKSNQIRPFTFHEFKTELGISQPLNFSKNNLISGISPSIRISNSIFNENEKYPVTFKESNIQILKYSFQAYLYQRKSKRDIYPKWGIVFLLKHIHTPFTSFEKGFLSSVESYFYLPGLAKHHGFKLYGAYQKVKFRMYKFFNEVDFVRGLLNPGLEDLYRFGVNYKFPLIYPDLDLSSFMYLKRMTLGFFFDYGYGKIAAFGEHHPIDQNYYSTGMEINARAHFLSFIAPVDIGFKTIYLPQLNNFVFEFILSVNFSMLY